jgi:hypothetical protein
MDKPGTWIAVTAVGIGFIILVWLLFSKQPDRKNKK